jgi:ribose/xylose/arabinose/galactoside ABC-type transport system permease subunit
MDTSNQLIKPKDGEGSNLKSVILEQLSKYFLLIATLLVAIVFTTLQPKFISVTNLLNIMVTASLTGTLGIAMMFPLIVGEINFAIGAQATIAAAIVGVLMAGSNVPYPIAILCGLAFPLILGLIAIVLNIKIGVPTFIISLALAPFADGLTKIFTKNTVYFSDKWDATAMGVLGQKMIGQVPLLAIVFLVTGILVLILLDHTRIGKYMFAVGANRSASEQVGINVDKIKIIGFLLGSAIAAFAGILIASREYKVWPSMGSDKLMAAVAIAMLSATFYRPGRFNIQGVLVAALFVTMIENGVRLVGAPFEVRYLVEGLTFLFAVGFIAKTRKGGLPAVQFGR